jgi:hypothetical protein
MSSIPDEIKGNSKTNCESLTAAFALDYWGIYYKEPENCPIKYMLRKKNGSIEKSIVLTALNDIELSELLIRAYDIFGREYKIIPESI